MVGLNTGFKSKMYLKIANAHNHSLLSISSTSFILLFFVYFRSLLSLKADNGTIVQYFPGTSTEKLILNIPSNPLHMSVDSVNDVVYWINIDGSNHVLMRTFYNGTTQEIHQFAGTKSTMKVAVGKDHVFVLDIIDKEINLFSKTKLQKISSFGIGETSTEMSMTYFEGW